MPDLIISTTQEHLNIETITHDLVFLKDGSASLVLQVSAINFGLLSQEEQDATIYAYAGLLNSLSFPIQITVISAKKDISQYLEVLSNQAKKIKDPLLKKFMDSYQKFVEEVIVEQNVLEKKFYVTIPYFPLTLTKTIKLSQEYIQKVLNDLEPKRNHLIKQFARIGLTAKQLNTQQLIKLFYQLYNPESHATRTTNTREYEAPIVAPNIAKW